MHGFIKCVERGTMPLILKVGKIVIVCAVIVCWDVLAQSLGSVQAGLKLPGVALMIYDCRVLLSNAIMLHSASGLYRQGYFSASNCTGGSSTQCVHSVISLPDAFCNCFSEKQKTQINVPNRNTMLPMPACQVCRAVSVICKHLYPTESICQLPSSDAAVNQSADVLGLAQGIG